MEEPIRGLIAGIFNGSISVTDLSKSEILDIETALREMKKSIPGEMPAGGFTFKAEMVKFDSNGQWSVEKADNTINYAEMNKPKPKKEPMTIDYSSGKPEIKGPMWNSKDVTGKPRMGPKQQAKEDRISEAVRSRKAFDNRR